MVSHIDRRKFLINGAVAGTLACGASRSRAAETEMRTQTFTYKRVGDLEIKADVYRPADQVVRPVCVWLHGGALIMGHRAGVSDRVKQHAAERGYALVSLDYRLAPETQLPQIIQDLEDAFTWIHQDGPRLFHADPHKVALTGGSAGGYLALTAGFRVRPRPTVLLSFWGYGDLVGDWYSQPSPHPRHHTSKLTREEAFQQVSGPPISDARDRKGDGGAFYQYCRQQGLWPQAVSGWDPRTEPEKFYPFMAEKNVTPEYPPTALIHGTEDTDVPYELSVHMTAQFQAHHVPHELLTIPGGEHGLAGGDPRLIDEAHQRAFAFVDRYLQAGG